MGGRQNYDPFLGTLNTRCRIIIGTQKGTIILTTTHIETEIEREVPNRGLRAQTTSGMFTNEATF